MTARKKNESVQAGSGNVFADMNLPKPRERLVKAELASLLCRLIAERGWTPAQAAKQMRLDAPKVSVLLSGLLKGFTAERLFRCLNDLGQEIDITVRPARQAGQRGHVHVLAEK